MKLQLKRWKPEEKRFVPQEIDDCAELVIEDDRGRLFEVALLEKGQRPTRDNPRGVFAVFGEADWLRFNRLAHPGMMVVEVKSWNREYKHFETREFETGALVMVTDDVGDKYVIELPEPQDDRPRWQRTEQPGGLKIRPGTHGRSARLHQCGGGNATVRMTDAGDSWARDFRIHYRGVRDVAFDRYGEMLGTKVMIALDRAMKANGDSCQDNLRVCEVGVEREEAIYEAARESGCCGSHDEVVTIWYRFRPRRFRIGFNYGH